jgi:hypothetical protein
MRERGGGGLKRHSACEGSVKKSRGSELGRDMGPTVRTSGVSRWSLEPGLRGGRWGNEVLNQSQGRGWGRLQSNPVINLALTCR